MRELRTAEILAIGSELLTAHRLDTNSLFLTGRLNDLGIDVRSKAVVGDDRGDLGAVLRQALARADVIVTSGGLGPTEDDLTREVIADVLGLALEEDADVLASIRARFARRGFPMPERNRRQALVPRGATLLPNANGTAPGLWIESGGQILILLPGPPRELQTIFDTHAVPRLEARSQGQRLRRRVLKLTGRAESQVDEVAQPIYTPFAQGSVPIQTTILATPGQIELHLCAHGADVGAMDAALEAGVTQLAQALSPAVFSVDGRSLETVVGELLKQNKLTIAVAESCTGGLVLGRLTEISGSSAWVIGGVVAYSDEVKKRQLGVAESLLKEHGAVSEPVARAMAEGVVASLKADIGVAVTGVAGPTGGSDAKPVGTVVIAVAGAIEGARTFRFLGDRQMVRLQSVAAALDMVRRKTSEGLLRRT
jgi:competence/damage-inducible protein CinA-like protein